MIILLYIFDALRADFLSCYGYSKETSPNIDDFSKDCVVYENAYSTATWTKASLCSIISSQYPRSIKMMHQMDPMPNVETVLPEEIKDNGFKTYGISANAFFSPDFGFSRGFDDLIVLQKDEELLRKGREAKDLKRVNETEKEILERLGIDRVVMVLSKDINKRIFPYIKKEKEINKFFMVWSMDTHGPYYLQGNKSYFGNSKDDFILERDVKSKNIEKVKSLYCDMIRYGDHYFGELISELKTENLYDESLIIVAGDHGDSFGDHGSILGRPITSHIGPVYEEVLKVPLIIKYPHQKFSGQRIKQLVQLIDIYPTILDVCGMKSRNSNLEGVSLVPSSNQLNDDRVIFAETQFTPFDVYSAAIRRSNFKLMKVKTKIKPSLKWRKFARSILYSTTPSIMLFDLEKDPKEKINLKMNDKIGELMGLYNNIISKCDKKSINIEKKESNVGDDVKSRLKALGYLD